MDVLKTNNRFASLLEANRPPRNHNSHQIRGVIHKNKYKYKPDDSKIKHVEPSIDMNDFPSLIATGKPDNITNVIPNYIQKLQYQPNTESEKVETLPYGWGVITPNTYNNPKVRQYLIENSSYNPLWMDSFVELYNKRKEDYIALWGEETYENVFLFPNYDYNYFDEEDEEEEDDEEDYEEYYDEYYN
jgi:hypothetical protein